MMKPPQAAKPGDPSISGGYINAEIQDLFPLVVPPVASRGVKLCLNRSKSENWACVYYQSSLFIKLSPSVLYQASVYHSLLAALASFTKDKHKLSFGFEDANN